MRRHPTASGDSSPKRFNDSFLLFGLLWSTFYVDKNPPGKKGGFLIFEIWGIWVFLLSFSVSPNRTKFLPYPGPGSTSPRKKVG